MRIGSLFSGYGGLDAAVQAVYGGDLAWYSEIEPAACRVLTAHHPGVPNLGDITTVDWADVPPVDILTGGYPCQPFSHAGKREGTNDDRHLWPYVRDAIAALRPMVAVFENVDGHRSLGLDVVLGDLADMGLSARWGVVRAADAGAPHGRKRVFIVVTHPAGSGRQRNAAVSDRRVRPERIGHAVAGAGEPPAADADVRRRQQRDTGVWLVPVTHQDGGGVVAADAEGGRRGTGPRPATRTGGHEEPRAGDGGGSAAADAPSGGSRARGSVGASEGGAAAGTSRDGQRAIADADSAGGEARARRLRAGNAGRRKPMDGGAEDRGGAAADADGDGHGGGQDARGVGSLEGGDEGEPRERERTRGESGAGSPVAWGKYELAIRRWEHVLGRPAPDPTIPGANGRPRLSPVFVEWMMGLPAGHVTGHGLSAAQELKMLGNGVVPQQAELALRMLAVAP